MDKNGNLINLRDRTPEERREIARKGGQAAQAAIRRRKTLKEELDVLLSDPQLQKELCESLIAKALTGSASAFATIRDTVGEKPRTEISADMTYFDTVEEMTPEQYAIARQYFMSDSPIGRAISQTLGVQAKISLLEELMNESTRVE